MKPLVLTMALTAAITLAGAARANDDNLCLDCHEPTEDWQGMSAQEILEQAMDGSIKRHADNQEFTQEQLEALIAEMLDPPAPE